ncbi:MAG: DUF4870 domain-containing protein [Bdellovibrionota bacterium]|nr:DUF4870 domain-containing protein [Bdellovibrionota bacterium]
MEEIDYRREQRNWSVMMHLSILLGNTILPVIGWFVPLMIWLSKRDQSVYLDRVGRQVNNFLLNLLVLHVFGLLLTTIGIGLLVIGVVYVISILLPIYAAIKESKNEIYEYPSFFSFLI